MICLSAPLAALISTICHHSDLKFEDFHNIDHIDEFDNIDHLDDINLLLIILS